MLAMRIASPERLGLVTVDIEDLLHVGLEVLERTHVLRAHIALQHSK
jgi:hypothetical protein